MCALMADNCSFADALARELGVERLRCVPHILALVFAQLSFRFKLFMLCTAGLSAIIHAGGGLERQKAMEDAGLNVPSLKCLTTRWNQTHDAGAYLLSTPEGASRPGFETVRELLETSPAFNRKKATGILQEEEPDKVDDEEVRVTGSTTKKKVGLLLNDVKAAFGCGPKRSYNGLFELAITITLSATLPNLITASSCNLRQIPADIEARLKQLAFPWTQILKNAGWLGVPIAGAFLKCNWISFSQKEKDALVSTYKDTILESVKSAALKYAEYMEPAVKKLQRRMQFEPTNKPSPYVVGAEMISIEA